MRLSVTISSKKFRAIYLADHFRTAIKCFPQLEQEQTSNETALNETRAKAFDEPQHCMIPMLIIYVASISYQINQLMEECAQLNTSKCLSSQNFF